MAAVVAVASLVIVVQRKARSGEEKEAAKVVDLLRGSRFHPSGQREGLDEELGMDYYRRRRPYPHRHQLPRSCRFFSYCRCGRWWHTATRGAAVENLRAAAAPRAVVADPFSGLRLDGPAPRFGLVADASSVVWTAYSGVEVDLEVVVVAQLGQSKLRSAVAVGALFRRWPRHWAGGSELCI